VGRQPTTCSSGAVGTEVGGGCYNLFFMKVWSDAGAWEGKRAPGMKFLHSLDHPVHSLVNRQMYYHIYCRLIDEYMSPTFIGYTYIHQFENLGT
jgi:hypothetical protein